MSSDILIYDLINIVEDSSYVKTHGTALYFVCLHIKFIFLYLNFFLLFVEGP